MKKKIIIAIIIILIILSIPIIQKNKEGKEYKAILYQIIIKDNDNTKGKIIKILNIEVFNNINNKENKIIKSLDEFYQNDNVKKYKDIRELKKDYTEQEAINDNCFVIEEDVYNDSLFAAFFDNYENQKNDFIRVVQFTIEQDMLIYDILYDKNSNKLYLVPDNTRDRNVNDKIELYTYDHMTKYEYLNHTYWVLYNNELTNETLFGDNTFIVSYV